MDEAARKRRAAWLTHVHRPGDDVEDASAFDDSFWARIPIDERAEAAWQISREVWGLTGEMPENERRLSRSVTRIIRR